MNIQVALCAGVLTALLGVSSAVGTLQQKFDLCRDPDGARAAAIDLYWLLRNCPNITVKKFREFRDKFGMNLIDRLFATGAINTERGEFFCIMDGCMDPKVQEVPVRYWKKAIVFKLWKALEGMIVEDAESRMDPLQEIAIQIKMAGIKSQKDAELCDHRLKLNCVCEWLGLPCNSNLDAINEAMKALICDKGAANRLREEMPIFCRIFGVGMENGFQALLCRVQSFVEEAQKAGVS